MNDDVYDQKDCLNKQNETNKDQLKPNFETGWKSWSTKPTENGFS